MQIKTNKLVVTHPLYMPLYSGKKTRMREWLQQLISTAIVEEQCKNWNKDDNNLRVHWPTVIFLNSQMKQFFSENET